MKPVLLIIGEITPRMAERFSAAFTCHYLDKIANTEQFPSSKWAICSGNSHIGA